eukprot:7112967-Pyramimonas_sp.AAC.1
MVLSVAPRTAPWRQLPGRLCDRSRAAALCGVPPVGTDAGAGRQVRIGLPALNAAMHGSSAEVFHQRQEMLETMGIHTGGKLAAGAHKRVSSEDVWQTLASAFHTVLMPGPE